MTDLDRTLIDSTNAHRDRLSAALVFGRQEHRRKVKGNTKRLVGSVIVAAVACAGCLGTAFVLDFLERQKQEEAVKSFQEALASNPLRAGDGLVEDEASGFLVDTQSGSLIDPRTGFTVDRETLLATDPEGNTIDPRIGWYFDPATGFYRDPSSGITIDPDTLQVVETEE